MSRGRGIQQFIGCRFEKEVPVMASKESHYMNIEEDMKEEFHSPKTVQGKREQLQMEITSSSSRQSTKRPHWYYMLMVGIPVIAILVVGVAMLVIYQAHVSGLNNEALHDNVSCPSHHGFKWKKFKGSCLYFETQMPLTCPTHAPNECITCPSGSKWEKFNGSCYYFETERILNWADANHECLMRGATLASIHSEEENNFINRTLVERNNDIKSAWLGLFYSGTTWKWSDFSPVDIKVWGPGEPNNFGEECMEFCVNNNGKRKVWNDKLCSRAINFVCRKVNRPF